jgi:hypothetical protein
MGIKESFPVLRGKSVSFNKKEEKKYFYRTHEIIKNNYINNCYNYDNLIRSLEVKTFTKGIIRPDKRTIKDYTWIEYLIVHLNKLKVIYNAQWTNDLLIILKEQNVNIPENKYFSDFFFHEYRIKYMPKFINDENEKLENNPISNYRDIYYTLYNSELSVIKDKNYCELDILDNLGGSYLEVNDEEQDTITAQYQERRNKVKKYMKIFKEHLYDNRDHPIYQIIYIFNNLFSNYIKNKIKDYEYQLEKGIIEQQRFDTLIKNLETEITYCLQEVISRMHSAIKLFYSTTIDYKFFQEEKDDLMNLVISLFFRTGRLYENILNLYSYSFKEEYEIFQSKLIELRNIKPHKVGIKIRFCLDENTLKLQKRLKNEKNKKNETIEKIEPNKEMNTSYGNMKKGNLFQKISDDNKLNDLFTIKENDEEKEDFNSNNNINNINIVPSSKNKIENGNLLFYLTEETDNINPINYKFNMSDYFEPLRSRTKPLNLFKEDEYILEKASLLDNSRIEMYYNPSSQIRNSVNNFNNRKLFFPKLFQQIKKNIDLDENLAKSQFSKSNSEKGLPIPYLSAINLMKSIRNYKTPFEKIILIAAINDQIMENATSFWKDMEQYIEKDYLYIEADEIMSIFLYIIIQSQMPEILLYCKIINNFTTQFTKGFNISYNYTLLEASMDYINGIKDIKELCQKENGFMDASRSILDISLQRINRFSLGSPNN